MDKKVIDKRLYIRAFGCQMGAVAQDDFGDIKEAK